jgi:hypothetical protein
MMNKPDEKFSNNPIRVIK